MARVDTAEKNVRAELERFADRNILSIFVTDLDVMNTDLRPIFAHSRFPLAQVSCRFTTVLGKVFV